MKWLRRAPAWPPAFPCSRLSHLPQGPQGPQVFFGPAASALPGLSGPLTSTRVFLPLLHPAPDCWHSQCPSRFLSWLSVPLGSASLLYQ